MSITIHAELFAAASSHIDAETAIKAALSKYKVAEKVQRDTLIAAYMVRKSKHDQNKVMGIMIKPGNKRTPGEKKLYDSGRQYASRTIRACGAKSVSKSSGNKNATKAKADAPKAEIVTPTPVKSDRTPEQRIMMLIAEAMKIANADADKVRGPVKSALLDAMTALKAD